AHAQVTKPECGAPVPLVAYELERLEHGPHRRRRDALPPHGAPERLVRRRGLEERGIDHFAERRERLQRFAAGRAGARRVERDAVARAHALERPRLAMAHLDVAARNGSLDFIERGDGDPVAWLVMRWLVHRGLLVEHARSVARGPRDAPSAVRMTRRDASCGAPCGP